LSNALQVDKVIRGKGYLEFKGLIVETCGPDVAVNCELFQSNTTAHWLLWEYLEPSSILTSGNTYISPLFYFLRNRLQIHLYDIDPNTMQPDLNHIEGILKVHSPSILHIPTIAGIIPENTDELVKLADKYNCVLVEDAAHSFGCYSSKGVKSGTWADFTVFSFHASKPLSTVEGGAIVSPDRTVRNQKTSNILSSLAMIGNQGKCDPFDSLIHSIGHSARLPEFLALIGLAYLDCFDEVIEKLSRLASVYDKELKCDGVTTFDLSGTSYYKYPIYFRNIKSVNTFKKLCSEFSIKLPASVYETPIYSQPVFIEYQGFRNPLDGVEKFSKKHVCLPLHLKMSRNNLKDVIKVVKYSCYGET
jgi:dTDP-4-amino-4,6-dideoxygalactose transaminase